MPKANYYEKRLILSNSQLDPSIDYADRLLKARTDWAISFLESLGY